MLFIYLPKSRQSFVSTTEKRAAAPTLSLGHLDARTSRTQSSPPGEEGKEISTYIVWRDVIFYLRVQVTGPKAVMRTTVMEHISDSIKYIGSMRNAQKVNSAHLPLPRRQFPHHLAVVEPRVFSALVDSCCFCGLPHVRVFQLTQAARQLRQICAHGGTQRAWSKDG